MKFVCTLGVILSALMATPSFAEQGRVPQSTLDSLGLAGMEIVSDTDGQQVRGMSGNAFATGLGIVSGVLLDPSSGSFVFGTDANTATASAENAGLALTQAMQQNGSAINMTLNVASPNVFTGMLIGGAGGGSSASSN